MCNLKGTNDDRTTNEIFLVMTTASDNQRPQPKEPQNNTENTFLLSILTLNQCQRCPNTLATVYLIYYSNICIFVYTLRDHLLSLEHKWVDTYWLSLSYISSLFTLIKVPLRELTRSTHGL